MTKDSIFTEHTGLDPQHLLGNFVVGSRAFGLATSESDTDRILVFVPPLGFKVWNNLQLRGPEGDLSLYPLKEFLLMLLKANPNVFVVPGLTRNYWVHSEFDWVLDPDLFLSARVRDTFGNYARDQERDAFGLTTGRLGQARRSDLDRYGYVRKSAAHTIRLLRMGVELLRDHRLVVERPDAPQLLAIRNGEWTPQAVKREIAERFSEIAALPDTLPPLPQEAEVEALYTRTVKKILW